MKTPKVDIDMQTFIENSCHMTRQNALVEKEIYELHDIKRGLRNADGTGVLAGVSRIGSVQGYAMVDDDRVPAEGNLYYRGISVQDIAAGFWADKRQGMAETAYLLLFGALPTKEKLDDFSKMLSRLSALPDGWADDIFKKMPSENMMNMLSRSVLGLYAIDENPDDTSLENVMRQCIRLIAVFPSLVASSYASVHGYYSETEANLGSDNRSLAENFLYRLRKDHIFSPEEARLLDLCMVLHAEHGGGNNSTFTCRVLSSSGTDTYSAVAGAISSLKGPLHGGANERVCSMMQDIKTNVSCYEDENEIAAYLEKILKKEAGDKSGKIYGMGHAIYTQSDPRAVLLKQYARDLVATKSEELQREFALMERVEALSPQVFARCTGKEKVISANVDFYSGFIYGILGIPQALFTPLFAAARISGWAAHRIEEGLTGGRIIRPAYKAIELEKPYCHMEQR